MTEKSSMKVVIIDIISLLIYFVELILPSNLGNTEGKREISIFIQIENILVCDSSSNYKTIWRQSIIKKIVDKQ